MGESSGPSVGTNPYPGFHNAGHEIGSSSSSPSAKPYSNLTPEFFPYQILASGQPKPGNPLYTINNDRPKLKLIGQQLTSAENYSSWSREFRGEVVTKDKEVFINGMFSIPFNERIARLWKRCNQLVKTWFGNCIAPEVATRLHSTEDSKKNVGK